MEYVSQELIDEVKKTFYDFNPLKCTKKDILAVRKMMAKLKSIKYPKKQKV